MWFGAVSFLTIGYWQFVVNFSLTFFSYGDIVPRYWLSKVLTCVLAYATLVIFETASTLVGVGMTIFMEGESKVRQKRKLEPIAARVIQTWHVFSSTRPGHYFAIMQNF